MPDQTRKRREDAGRFLSAIDMLMRGFEDAVTLDTKMTSAGEAFVDADFTDVPVLAHLDAATLAAARAKLATIKTWMATNRADFDKIRP